MRFLWCGPWPFVPLVLGPDRAYTRSAPLRGHVTEVGLWIVAQRNGNLRPGSRAFVYWTVAVSGFHHSNQAHRKIRNACLCDLFTSGGCKQSVWASKMALVLSALTAYFLFAGVAFWLDSKRA